MASRNTIVHEIIAKLNKRQSSEKAPPLTEEEIAFIERVLTADETAPVNFEKVIKNFRARRVLLERTKKGYSTQQELDQMALGHNLSSIREFRRLLVEELKSTDPSEDNIKFLREQILALKKINIAIKQSEEATRKGAATGKYLLQRTLGITEAWGSDDKSGMKGIAGAAKGFVKGLNKSITLTNLLSTVIVKLIKC